MKKQKVTIKSILGMICFVMLLLSVFFAVIKLFTAPESPADALPHERLKSDYLLMVLQCLLGIAVLFLPAIIEKRFRIDIPNFMEGLYFVFLYCAIYLGEVRNFYFVIPHWDLILHTFSGVMLGALGFSIIDIMNDSRRVKISLSPAFIALFAFCFALAAGCIWEIYEYIMDGVFHMNMQKFMLENGTQLIGRLALADTMEDIVVDTLGALFTCVIGFFSLRRKHRRENISDKQQEVCTP